MAKTFGFTFGRDTWANHKAHSQTTEQRVIQAHQIVAADKPVKIARSTNDQFLEAIRDIGMTKAVNDPDSITIDQALKATQILENRKDKGGDGLRVLINIMTGHSPQPVIVEGEVL